ncbi:hypothetical protein ACWEF6_21290 [Amycolatopsis sp. NPDC004772]
MTTEFAATADVPQATRHRMRTRLAATLAAGLLAVGAVAAPVAATEINQPSSGTSAEQVVAFGVPAWMGRMFWNQVNKQHTTPRCTALCGLQEGPMA